jgi:uridine kinase
MEGRGLMNSNFKDFANLVELFENIPRKQLTLLVGIDGCGGSGKTTFAERVKKELNNVTMIHMDDFYLPSAQIINAHPAEKPIGADFDWKRMLIQVLEPLTQDEEGYYQRYDWETDRLAEWHSIPVGGIVIIEGVYSIRNELFDRYDLTFWVDCPREMRLLRGLKRDGEVARGMWEDYWMVSEDLYVREHRPHEKADIVMEGFE